MKTICVINNKGGVGKTTSAINIGAALSKFGGHKTLLVDLDPQSSLTKSFTGDSIQVDIGDVLTGRSSIDKALIRYSSTISVLPASLRLIDKEQEISNSPKYPFNLKFFLEKNAKDYDFVILDCPPSLSVLTRIALVACQYYVIPMQAEYFSYEGLRSLITYTNELSAVNDGVALLGVFATRYNPKTNKRFSREIINQIKEHLADRFFEQSIRENIALSEAQAEGKPIFDYEEGCNGAQDYHALCVEILNKLNK